MDLIKKKKPLAGNLITLAILCALFVLVLILMEAGALTRHIRSMLVPICINIILAVSLNLTVGFLGELTLGHAGFMSVGAYAGCLFSIAMQDILPTAVRFPLAMLVGGLVAAVFGGIGSMPGAMLGGVLLGVIEILGKAYVSTELGDAFVFAVLIVVLLFKPTGLLGRQVREKV